jgi:hypothetical protein
MIEKQTRSFAIYWKSSLKYANRCPVRDCCFYAIGNCNAGDGASWLTVWSSCVDAD